MAPKADIFQLKISLRGIRPPIWRRVQVPADISLARFHRVIQEAMGWEDCHLHAFTVGDEEYYGDAESAREMGGQTTARKRLNQVVPGEGAHLRYDYDFGDSWEHDIVVEKVLPAEPGQVYPQCLAGRRACPPEDVGGIWGYEEFLAAIADPDNEEYQELLEWVGGDFDPEAFDLEATNRILRGIGGR